MTFAHLVECKLVTMESSVMASHNFNDKTILSCNSTYEYLSEKKIKVTILKDNIHLYIYCIIV